MWETVYGFLKAHIELTLIGAITLIQISPIKINPWSWIAKAVHKVLFGEIDKKLDLISGKVDRLEAQQEEDKATQARTHILRFASELYEKRTHTQEYFQQILDEIKMYSKFCDSHPGFLNGRTEQACQKIKEVYNQLWGEQRF